MTGLDLTTIKNVPLFSDLTDTELQLVMTSGTQLGMPPKNIVFQEGDPGHHLLVILSGHVQILLYGKDGKEFILSVLGKGDFFGEMAILESAPRSATVKTVEECEFFVLGQKELAALLTQHPGLAVKILKSISRRLRKLTEQVRGLVMFDIYGRLGRCLLNLAETQGSQSSDQFVITNRPSFQELANMVGCSREALSRTMKALKNNGCLTVTKKAIYINKVWE